MVRLLHFPQTPMGHTHTKLLAGAFSVLSVMQFFMVSNLSNEFNTYTENATASMVASMPMRTARTMRAMKASYTSNQGPRDLAKQKAQLDAVHAAASSDDSSTEVKGPKGLVMVRDGAGREHAIRATHALQPSTQPVTSTDAQ